MKVAVDNTNLSLQGAIGVSSPPPAFALPSNTAAYRPPSEIGSTVTAPGDPRHAVVTRIVEEYLQRKGSAALQHLLALPPSITMSVVKFRMDYPDQRYILAFIQAMSAFSLYTSKQYRWKRLSSVGQSDIYFVANIVEQSTVRVLRMHGRTSALPESVFKFFSQIIFL